MFSIPVSILNGLGMYDITDKGIFRSSCKVWLETYNGAIVIILKDLNWYVCSILMFDGLAHPHSSVSYVHMGFSMGL
jgi:hypothetical protein